ncbi:hypothetical protein V2J09_000026 [Rumex salicifolius]
MEAWAIKPWNSKPPLHFCSLLRRNNNFPTYSPLTSRISISICGTLPLRCNRRTFPVPYCSPLAKFSKDNAGGDKILTSGSVLALGKRLLNFTGTNFLPMALVGAVALGMVWPALGCQASKYSILNYSTFGIFFISGLKLNDGEVGEISKAWPAVLYGLASILLFCPLFSRLILKVQLVPQEFSTGLAIFSCMPTTLTSGVALTQIVGGNSALALALTVMSNTLGILVVSSSVGLKILSWWIWCIHSNMADISESYHHTPGSLIFGKGIDFPRYGIGLARYVDHNRRTLSVTSTLLLSLTPWIQVSKSRSLLMIVELKVFIAAIVLGILLHLALLAFNAISVKCMSIGFGDYKKVFAKKGNARVLIMVCSQKALLIAVTVVAQLDGALGNSGLLVLPCIAAHINQIIFDSFLVNFWLQKDEKLKLNEEP